ncbi:hypothetical protein FZ041_06080 [Selenomonas caprae]|uniref:Polysaccharide deacetylase family protein n=1 Tax=Selenomonas caprae TaxID=2606905 RepID=A0A5D6WMS8_9FIRM|nr:hypothetical protein [Selenomonas caprae]TYZ29110.1 hypothetical protein FZ041_06080 [Selenomonas caprae]
MKIIISHDVDHINVTEHIFKDLILEKMFLRSMLGKIMGRISWKTCFRRMSMLFYKRMNRIEEVMMYDHQNKIPSTFFFGMSNGLGMSYSRQTAAEYIVKVVNNGFDVGVHGIEYMSQDKICDEHDAFKEVTGMTLFGVRNHYVRFDDETFYKMNRAGYLFDSTWFNKENIELKNPYKIGDMWEFPLHIMDVYVCEEGGLEDGMEKTYKIIDEADAMGIKYLTILFHDYQFDDVFAPDLKCWYMKTIEYCKRNKYEFISYRDAIKELDVESKLL